MDKKGIVTAFLLAAGLLMGAVTGLALRVILPYLNRLKLK